MLEFVFGGLVFLGILIIPAMIVSIIEGRKAKWVNIKII